MPEFFPEINLHELEDHQLSQYVEATKLNALIRGIINVYKEHAFDVLEQLDRTPNVYESSGILLDWAGIRMGFVRPRIPLIQDEFFGLAGTSERGGRPLDQAPFYTPIRLLTAYEPIKDHTYRCLLLARARKLHGDVGMDCWEDCLRHLQGGGGTIEISRVSKFQVSLTHENLPETMRLALVQEAVGQLVLPFIPGIEYRWRYKRHDVGGLVVQVSVTRPEGWTGRASAHPVNAVFGVGRPEISAS